MAILKNSCCGCCKVREGSIVVGALFLLLHLIDLGMKANSIVNASATGQPVAGTDAASVAIDVVAIIIDCLMIYGVVKAIGVLLIVWVVFVIIILVAEFIIVVVVTIITFAALRASVQSEYEGSVFGIAILILIPVWIIYILVLLLVIYGILVVYSHYQNLRDGIVDDGTAPPPGAYPPGTAAPPPGGMYPQAAAPPPGYEMQGIPPKV
ncbi:hypothetical protein Bbelb_220100 [Branchiostoma belcheri]|nr:hypothetical protein Bbelb_220100 [Branchiostoma belcheri]